jgi:DNA-directed RNA polymerase specialized sigma24 family protein
VSVELSDAEALRRSRRDPEAICALYDRHLPRLVAALGRMGDRELAFDIAQETFAVALERGHEVKLPPEGSAWPWLWTVARNRLRDYQRRDAVDRRAWRRLGIRTVTYDASAVEGSPRRRSRSSCTRERAAPASRSHRTVRKDALKYLVWGGVQSAPPSWLPPVALPVKRMPCPH